ncbi:2-oxoacid:acceptor oxidoreductase subunit alpha [Tepidibacter formicigenes]|jgi:2-oxoglutarate ferredoxin oxidoreductase subunit alpha|uniref:2-oxoglutarate ferredoxin oxidoreductase subunit alpha n=1 Tax=Tepidibacter formicigenes DSM 15518 TaxID=1123349 RepID=A0A1M6M9Q5_9FIRM|nr:2-oxoacid:acceptor oxidoreductase subunit alpha [Tepidibacter formicigenes]SHJ80154.1 2-oxoglutarate ferredoxin oxidoreductase subunit alpha [Tepidibacter formicigenes DSM 15518]
MHDNIKFLQGNEACVHGAIYAGMRFFAGYPITPSTEITELSSVLLPRIGGRFIQMEDEIASMAAVIGGSLGGLKSMTATSGPGFSLKQENIGYASITEIPCVIVNVQRCGPSTGLPTSPSQGEVMQAKWGTHGDHPIIALSPTSVTDTFYLTIKAFNFSEKYRTPVILLLDEVIGHMREKVKIPKEGEVEIINRKKPTCNPDEYKAYEYNRKLVPPMANFGEGYKYNITGLVHDETGFPINSTKEAEKLLNRLMRKIDDNLDDILIYEEYLIEDADVLFITFGCMARSTKESVNTLRKEGINAGMLVLKTIWPFPEEKVKSLSKKIKNIFVPEMNLGQIRLEVERVAYKDSCIYGINKANGEIITPNEINDYVKEVLKCLVKL